MILRTGIVALKMQKKCALVVLVNQSCDNGKFFM